MKRIIIIDDDTAILDSVTLMFERIGYNVVGFKNGNSILAGKYDVPDIFFIDKQLPGIDGLEICRHLKQQSCTAGVPVVIMSASPAIKKLAEKAGADDFIEKPYTIQQLREIVLRHQ